MKTYDELTKELDNDDGDDEDLILNEMMLDESFLKLSLIGGFLVKTKQYGSRIDTEVRNLSSDINSWVNNKNEDLDKKKLGEVFNTLGKLHFLQRKMTMYTSLVSGSTGIGVGKSFKILQKLERLKGKR
tara:strand:+ start:515 stop:901 length:387 start_codon:yes stop_codon:yes gene_type:complete